MLGLKIQNSKLPILGLENHEIYNCYKLFEIVKMFENLITINVVDIKLHNQWKLQRNNKNQRNYIFTVFT